MSRVCLNIFDMGESLKVEITAEHNSGLLSTIELLNYDSAKEVLCCIVHAQELIRIEISLFTCWDEL